MFEKIIEKEWEKVKRRFIPSVWGVVIEEGEHISINGEKEEVKTAVYSPKRRTIVINPEFVKFVSQNLDNSEVIKAILLHEIGHERFFPMNAKATILLSYYAHEKFPEIGGRVWELYVDVVCNLKNILVGNNEILEFYRALDKPPLTISPEDKVCKYYYELQAIEVNEKNLDQKLKELKVEKELIPYVKRMLGIPFIQEDGRVFKNSCTDKESLEIHKSLILRFGFIMEDLLKDPKLENVRRKNEQGKKGQGRGGGKGKRLGDIKFTEKEVREAMKEIMKDVSKEEYEKIKKFLKDKYGIDLDKENSNIFKGIGVGGGKFRYNPEIISYYHELASSFPLYIKKKPIVSNTEDLYPDHYTEWNVGDPVKRLNIYVSGGKIFPGITQKMEEKRGKALLELDIPHALIMLDCSGSMPNPVTTKSMAVVSAYCLAINYLQNGSYVGGIVFGGDTYVHPFTRDLLEIERHFTIYDGGGTTINFEKVKELIPIPELKKIEKGKENIEESVKNYLKEEMLYKYALEKNVKINTNFKIEELKNLDIFVITDGGIWNLGETLTYLHSFAKKKARTHIFHTGNRYSFDKSKFPENVSVIPIDSEEDLMKTTIGVLKQIFT